MTEEQERQVMARIAQLEIRMDQGFADTNKNIQDVRQTLLKLEQTLAKLDVVVKLFDRPQLDYRKPGVRIDNLDKVRIK